MILRTYNAEGESKILVSEESFDEKSQLTKRIDFHQGKPYLVSIFEYNELGQTIGQSEELGDDEKIVTAYEYEENEIIRTTRSKNDSVFFEELIVSENGVTDIVQKENGELSEHIVKTEDGHGGFTRQFFDARDNELERHEYKWPNPLVSELRVLDSKSVLLAFETCLHNAKGQVIRKSVQNNEKSIVLLELATYTPFNDPAEIKCFDSTKDVQWTTTTFDYNQDQKFTESEVTDDQGNILEFVKRTYQETGEIDQEIYFKPFTKGTIARQIGDSEAYHLMIERE
ncbi:MAG: hypothetical protein ACI9RU_001784 [Litorivivens sp.]